MEEKGRPSLGGGPSCVGTTTIPAAAEGLRVKSYPPLKGQTPNLRPIHSQKCRSSASPAFPEHVVQDALVLEERKSLRDQMLGPQPSNERGCRKGQTRSGGVQD